MKPRFELRARPHSDPERQNEITIEVVRGDKVVANIYGSREGLHITCPLFGKDLENFHPLRLKAVGLPGVIIPLRQQGEECPWCDGTGLIAPHLDAVCPICQGKHVSPTEPGGGKTER